ncbi:Hypothetical predicted protein [Mytilus galloprovincialis]|uniref:Uncharacterized protein n=1 Tax=Mytilus galloprovincialis TaxID=29158 RepID=A0A8B6DS97_MYTGA|nr:Hypothetical predicted protein [Mytilus galloprovincialis]
MLQRHSPNKDKYNLLENVHIRTIRKKRRTTSPVGKKDRECGTKTSLKRRTVLDGKEWSGKHKRWDTLGNKDQQQNAEISSVGGVQKPSSRSRPVANQNSNTDLKHLSQVANYIVNQGLENVVSGNGGVYRWVTLGPPSPNLTEGRPTPANRRGTHNWSIENTSVFPGHSPW